MGTQECLPQTQVASAACSFSLCSRCSDVQKTCCQGTEIYITKGDVARIETATGNSSFFEFRVPDNPEYLDQGDDPVWERFVFRQDHSRRVLTRRANGDCHFLGSSGCRLGLESRPLVCRLYPYAYRDGFLTGVDGYFCPSGLLEPGQSLTRALGMEKTEDPTRWVSDLYREILDEDPQAPLEPHLPTAA